jgi:hypothetical protein
LKRGCNVDSEVAVGITSVAGGTASLIVLPSESVASDGETFFAPMRKDLIWALNKEWLMQGSGQTGNGKGGLFRSRPRGWQQPLASSNGAVSHDRKELVA